MKKEVRQTWCGFRSLMAERPQRIQIKEGFAAAGTAKLLVELIHHTTHTELGVRACQPEKTWISFLGLL